MSKASRQRQLEKQGADKPDYKTKPKSNVAKGFIPYGHEMAGYGYDKRGCLRDISKLKQRQA